MADDLDAAPPADAPTILLDAAGPTADGGADATPTDGGCARFPDAAFCSDFDDNSTIGTAPWTSYGMTVGTMAYDDDATRALSPPRSALLQLPAGDYSAGGGLTKTNAAVTFSTLKCSMDVRVDKFGDGRFHLGGIIVSNVGGERMSAEALVGGGAGGFDWELIPSDGGSHSLATVSSASPFTTANTWHRVTLSLDAMNVSLSYDNEPMSASIAHGLTPPFLKADLYIGAREPSQGRTLPWTLRFDDVRCFATP